MAQSTFQIVSRAAGCSVFTILEDVKAPDHRTALDRWHAKQPNKDDLEPKPGAGYIEGEGVIYQAVPKGTINPDTGLAN